MDLEPQPPNGGWGWMVVLGAALVNMVNQAMFSVFGLIYGEKLKEMSNGTAVGFTFVMSVNVMVTNFTGLAVGPLMKILHLRTITIVGIIFTGSGVIFCSFAVKTWQIVLGYGVLTGTGLGLLASVTFLAINSYFTTRKSTAVGLAMAGTSIGQMALPLLVGYLLEHYEFRGTCIAVGCLSFSGLIGAMLFKPLPVSCKKTAAILKPRETSNLELNGDSSNNNTKVKVKGEQSDQLTNSTHEEDEEKYLDDTTVFIEDAEETLDHDLLTNNRKQTPPPTTDSFKKIIELLNLSLLKDLTFVHYLVGLALAYTSSVSFTSFFPMFLQDEEKISVTMTTYCMTVLSCADILGRITISEISRWLGLKSKGAFLLGSFCLAISRSCLIEMSTFKYLLVGSFVSGYFRAPAVIFQNLVISEYIKDERLPSAVGLNMVMKGITVMICGQLLGLLKDKYSYYVCIHFLDGLLILVIISWSIQKIYTMFKKCDAMSECS